VKGNISNPRPDGRFKMVVTDNGYGTYNTTKSFASYANGWTGGSFYKNEADEVVIDAGLNSGTNVANTLMANLPDGYKAASPRRIIASTSTTACVIEVNTIGEITLRTTGSNASVGEGARFESKRN